MADIPKPDPRRAHRYFKNKLDFTTGPVEVDAWLKQKSPIQMIDVRAKEDYQKGHVPGAINLPKGTWENAEGLAQDKTNVVYCYSQQCHLAASAAYQFAKRGYSVIEMDGGFRAWTQNQLDVETRAKAA